MDLHKWTHALVLGSRSNGPLLLADPDWLDDLERQGIKCIKCGGFPAESLSKLDQIWVKGKPRQDAFCRVGWLGGGIALSVDMIDAIGEGIVREICYVLPVKDVEGFDHVQQRFLIEKKPRALVRGLAQSKAAVCSQCGGLIYAAVPWAKSYLLRQNWNGQGGITMLDEEILCTPAYYKTVLAPLKLPFLISRRVRMADTPEDGLPIEYDEIVRTIRKNGWIR